jgi:hypothetical protein
MALRLVVVMMVVLAGLALWAQAAAPAPVAGGAKADTNVAWNQAEIVLVGELTEAKTGASTMSLPPIFMNQLTFTVEKVLRGALDGKTITVPHSYQADANYPYETGQKYVVALARAQRQLSVRKLALADAATLKEAELACALPLGWKIDGRKAVSPWAGLGKEAWAAEMGGDAAKVELKCATTGRPALLAGPKAEWTVEAVPPAKAIQWTNPDGDGEYKLTVTNPTDAPLTVPALLSQDGKILWRESVVILCQDKVYPCPGSRGVRGKVESVVLKPKESVSTAINALALQGPEWPRGGYRIEFTFCLGEKAKTMSFYYLSRHHDALRDAAQKP